MGCSLERFLIWVSISINASVYGDLFIEGARGHGCQRAVNCGAAPPGSPSSSIEGGGLQTTGRRQWPGGRRKSKLACMTPLLTTPLRTPSIGHTVYGPRGARAPVHPKRMAFARRGPLPPRTRTSFGAARHAFSPPVCHAARRGRVSTSGRRLESLLGGRGAQASLLVTSISMGHFYGRGSKARRVGGVKRNAKSGKLAS